MPPKTDRHSSDSRQFNARVPLALHEAFHAECERLGIAPSAVIRALMQGFVDLHRNQVTPP